MTGPGRDALPEWPPGTVAILSTRGAAPHAIPVSTGVVAGPRLALIALARRRRSLEHLRADPRVALTVLAGGDIALTAHARASIVQDPMEVSGHVAAVALRVDSIQDHGQPRFVIEEGVRWRWTDPEAQARDEAIRAALAGLAAAAAVGG
ncbi:MAG: pyridoxamine 5'-phosphate oxidase family protein [Solirubrobacteraceae bacterium]